MLHKLRRLTLVAAALYAARRYYRNWGTTKEECAMTLPGDELVRPPAVQTTEGVWIDAPAGVVWPWLAQMGQDRGGLYSYEALENLIGLQFHNADRIHPEWQRLNTGDVVRLAPNGWMGLRNGVVLRVAEVTPEKAIVLTAAPELASDAVWSFHIVPHWDDRCRLLVRHRIGMRHPGEVLGNELAGPATALMTRGMLRGIKRRVEAHREAPSEGNPDGQAVAQPAASEAASRGGRVAAQDSDSVNRNEMSAGADNLRIGRSSDHFAPATADT